MARHSGIPARTWIIHLAYMAPRGIASDHAGFSTSLVTEKIDTA
jgi:hypothetical protein